MNHALDLEPIPGRYSVCRFPPDAAVPQGLEGGPFYTVSRTPDELSVVTERERVPAGVSAEHGWRAFRVRGPIDFGLTGVLAAVLEPLARESISIFAISTYDTDYILVREQALERARAALTAGGHRWSEPPRRV